MDVTLHCPQCGKEFTKKQWELKRNPTPFCGSECYHASRVGTPLLKRRRRHLKTCLVCGKEFEAGGRADIRDARARFCSVECRNISRYRHGAVSKTLTPVDAAYLAGFVDGEGSIMISPRKGVVSIRLSAVNTSMPIMQWLSDVTGLSKVHIVERANDNHKDVGHWSINGDAAESVIKQIEPYLKIKKQQAQLALETQARLRIPALKSDRTWMIEYMNTMKSLNRRGKKVS